MKKTLFLLTTMFIAMFCLNTNLAYGYTANEVTKTTEDTNGGIVDGGYYLITSKKSSKYNFFIYQERDNGYHYYSHISKESTIYNGTFDVAVNKSNIVKFIKQGENKWLIFDIKLHKYWNITNDVNNYISFVDNAKDGGTISLGIDKTYGLYIQITNSSAVTYNLAFDVSGEYEWHRKFNKGTYDNINLYRITDYSTTLDETQDLPTTTGTINVSLNISFSNNYYNTLMLPCSITGSYSAVFGTGVKAYSVKSSESDGITFTPVPDADGLQANTPYLIKGTFFNPPFIISNTTIDASGASNGINTVTTGGSTFNGIYKTGIDLGGNKYYVLYNDNFYSCESYKTMPIKLFRWYLSSSASFTKKLIIRDETTGINVPVSIAKEPTDNRIYRLDGTYAGTSFDALSKGIYISHGKKIIK